MAKSPATPLKIGFWHMLRDVLVASINKGQFPLALVGLFMVILAVRVPPEFLQNFANSVVEKLDKGDLWGWLLFVAVSAAWALNSFKSRKIYSEEVKRVSKEKSQLHKQLIGKDAHSSSSP